MRDKLQHKKFAKWVVALALTLPLGFSLFGSGQNAYAAAKTLIYCAESAPGGFDPGIYTDGGTYAASSQTIYSRLINFAHGSSELEPGLAERWEISSDGKVYTFHLRKGVKFQTTPYFKPSREFNADDVVFSFDRQANVNNPWHSYFPGQSYQYYESMDMPKIIKSVKKLDDYTVQFTLFAPEAPFLADMAMDFASIVSKEYADKLQASGKMAELNTKPVGTGPFIMAVNQKDVAVRFRANPDYWGGKQKLDNVVFAIISDGQVRLQKLKAGECDVINYPPINELAGLRKMKGITVLERPGMNVSYFGWNTLKAPFDKVEIRHALDMAIDRKAIAKIIYTDEVAMANTPLPPVIWGHDKTIPLPEYNPEKAKQILAAAGVKNLSFNITVTPSGSLISEPKRLAELLQSDFKKIGVQTNVNLAEWSEVLRLSQDKKRGGIVLMSWSGDNGDPDNFLGILFACSSLGTVNNSFFCNADYDKMINRAKRTSDIAERTKLYAQAQDILYKQAPVMLMGYTPNIAALRDNVVNYKIMPHGISFEGVDKK